MIFHFLNEDKSAYSYNIQEIADSCHVSTTSVFRLCKKLGLTGFSELKAVLKYAKQEATLIVRRDFQELYHQVVDYIARFDTEKILKTLRRADRIYLLARTDLELRLAKDFQRIFFPLGKTVIILPSYQALLSHKQGLDHQILWVFQLDSPEDFPLELQSPQWMASIFLVLISDFKETHILSDEHLYIPNLSQKQLIPTGHITPYSLAIEILYLKLQLT